MDKKQFQHLIVEPALLDIPRGYSAEAVLAIMMIVAHESHHGRYIKQLGKGPALGLIQMEPATHASVWKYGDSVWANAVAAGMVTLDQAKRRESPPATRLIYDLRYNVFMARQRLFMKPQALPTDPIDISHYLKKHWNSTKGKADGLDYLDAYRSWK
jgi:hypothetical protein